MFPFPPPQMVPLAAYENQGRALALAQQQLAELQKSHHALKKTYNADTLFTNDLIKEKNKKVKELTDKVNDLEGRAKKEANSKKKMEMDFKQLEKQYHARLVDVETALAGQERARKLKRFADYIYQESRKDLKTSREENAKLFEENTQLKQTLEVTTDEAQEKVQEKATEDII